MDFKVVHTLPGRIRLRTAPDFFTKYDHQYLARLVADVHGVQRVKPNTRTGSILVHYDESLKENDLLTVMHEIEPNALPASKGVEKSLGWSYIGYQIYRFLQPYKLKPYFAILGALPYIIKGVRSLLKLRMDIDLLDASALTSALLQRDFKSASTLTMLLKTGEYLEQWAKQRSRESLADSMSLNIGQVWVIKNKQEKQIPYSSIKVNDLVVVRAGTMIPVDGEIHKGDAVVNEASLTGEPLGVNRGRGDTVHAGTVIENGELVVRVRQKGDDTRIQKIIRLIQDSEASKADIETRANEIADRVVPFNFILAGLVLAITRNPMKMSTALSVDYSCALKLSTPLVFLSAMKEGLDHGVFFKGGASLEMLSRVDTVVFDKTGTLTRAAPNVTGIKAYNGYNEKEVLKIAACLEEHFPHPVAKAVVQHAIDKKVEHKEEHTDVKYIVAHGIATEYRDEHTVIGSRHFIADDEGIDLSIAMADEENAATSGSSMLYLARGGKLAGIIFISDPPREEAKEVIAMLRRLGIKHIYMLTGDHSRSAKKVADHVGITGYKAEMLPNEKAEAIRVLQSKGRCVAVVGDGMNDSPALSVADIGIALKGGADLAQQVADITITDSSLYALVIARLLAAGSMKRIRNNNITAVSLNSVFMMSGITGVLSSSMSVWLHNLTTLALSSASMRPLLPASKGRR